MPKYAKKDIYADVTNNIIKALESGVKPWSQPWQGGGTMNRPLSGATGKAYKGINVLNLWSVAQNHGFKSQYWFTFNQAKKIGGNLKGQKSPASVIKFSWVKYECKKTGNEKMFPSIKTWAVFNGDQIENLPAQFSPVPASDLVKNPHARIPHCEEFFAPIMSDVKTTFGPGGAYYRPSTDSVNLPDFESFENAESFYGVMAHEFAHSTMHKKRLDRTCGGMFGGKVYAKEELIAELASAFIAADLDIAAPLLDQNAAYIEHWLSALKEDKKAIFEASKHAEKAADFLHSYHESESESEKAAAA